MKTITFLSAILFTATTLVGQGNYSDTSFWNWPYCDILKQTAEDMKYLWIR